jgi:hypothetical protein
MSSNPPIVPSRNALRALRRLVYGGSTIIGAVGSVFTVAGVSYDTQRRVRLAERLIETKRTIRSVSNSNGAAHVARMFDAAEKGEDFGLNVTRSQKRNIRRDYSALSMESTHQRDTTEIRPIGSQHSLVGDERDGRKQAGKGYPSRKKSIRHSQGSTRIFGRSFSSPRGGKGLPPEFPIPDQRQLGGERSRRIATYDYLSEAHHHVQAVTEITYTDPPGAGQASVERYPGLQDTLDTLVCGSDGLTSDLLHTTDQNGDSGRHLGGDHSAVERILASTQQQHKLNDHGAYFRPGKSNLIQRAKADTSTSKNNRPQSNSSAAEKIVAATQQQHKLHSHTVYGRPEKANPEVHARLNEHVALWLNGEGASRSNSGQKSDFGKEPGFTLGRGYYSKRPSSTFLEDTSYLTPQRRNLSSSASEAHALPHSSLARTRSFRQKDSQTDLPPVKGPHSLTHISDRDIQEPGRVCPSPFHSVNDDQIGVDIPGTFCTENVLPENSRFQSKHMKQTEANVSNDISDQSSLHYVPKPSAEKDFSRQRSESVFGSDKAFEELVNVSRTEGYTVWDSFIRGAIEEHGTQAARQFWLNAMDHYATPGNTLDWNMVDDLHKHFHKIFWPALPPYFEFDSARLLTRHFLERHPTSQRSAELLFPLHGKEMELEAEYAAKGMAYPAKQKSRNLFANASKYLQDLWDEGHDAGKVISKLRTIIRVTKMQDIELAEDLFFGTIRRLSSNGQMEQAQVLFDEMAYYHSIEPSFLTRSVLVCGHARAGDWDRVAKEIEVMHNVHDLSRREPLGYSLMFNDVLVEYASRRSIAQTHDFLVHALGYWGLVPTSAISATAIQAFLTHRRYDLVREWIETVRVLFPQVDTETSRFAWHLGSVFEDINASCVEVEETCKALCYRKDASKVQASLREMVRLALARDLATKLHAAEVAEAGSQKKDSFPVGSPWALNHFLERAQSFAPDTSTEGQRQSTQSQEARELLSQVESVARLDKLFGTKGKFTDGPSANAHESPQPKSFENRTGLAQTESLQSNVPTELMRDLLPTLPQVERLLNQYYSTRKNEGLPISHAILKYTCQKLRKHDRKVDAMQLLKATFDGPYVQSPPGVMFDLPIMEMWLRFAYEAKSLSHCLTIFWAVLDAGEDYVLTSKFVLLANMSYHKVRQNRFNALAITNPSKHKELEYLLEKLRRRLWLNEEGSGPKIDKTRGAEYRKMKQKMRRRLVVGTQRTIEVSG